MTDFAGFDPDFVLSLTLNEALAAADVPLAGDPKHSLTRFNRNVRFWNDKRPYKTYAAVTFTREPGDVAGPAGSDTAA